MQIDVALIWTTEVFFNNIIDILMRDFFVFTMITKTRPWSHIYHEVEIPRPKNHDIEIPRPKNHDIKIPRPKNHDIEIPRPKSHDIEIPRLKSHDIEMPRPKSHDTDKRRKSHDIVIPRRFFRGQKTTTSRFQDQKAATSSAATSRHGILTLMPPDTLYFKMLLARQSVFYQKLLPCTIP